MKGIRSGRCVALLLISPLSAVLGTSIDELGNRMASKEDEAKSIHVKNEF
jgi:hypothetical protein